MLPLDLEAVKESDLQALKDNEVLERKTLEYKLSLPSNSDSDKKEFLADISSFANAVGGDLIFGMKSDPQSGVPESLDGVSVGNPDQEVGRLDNMIRDGIRPRIPRFAVMPIKLTTGTYAFVIRISKSWLGPHQVSFKGHDRFYSRSSNGKYPLDVPELRAAFNLSETAADHIRGFREERISSIVADEFPVPLDAAGKIVLHLIPYGSFAPGHLFDLSDMASHPDRLRPIYSSGWNYHFNLDGFVTYSGTPKAYSYAQLFKNGIIEAVDSSILYLNGDKRIPTELLETELVHSLRSFMGFLKGLNVEPPIFLFLTLVGALGCTLAGVPGRWFASGRPIDRNPLILPESQIESYDQRPENILKTQFDSIWNAFGYTGSPYYDPTGKWRLD